jgi:hypothetical protein
LRRRQCGKCQREDGISIKWKPSHNFKTSIQTLHAPPRPERVAHNLGFRGIVTGVMPDHLVVHAVRVLHKHRVLKVARRRVGQDRAGREGQNMRVN